MGQSGSAQISREHKNRIWRDWYARTGGNTPQRVAKRRIYHARRRKDPKVIPLLQEARRKYTEKFRVKLLAKHAIKRAVKNGIAADPIYMKEVSKLKPKKCPCCGIQLDYSVVVGGSTNPKPRGPSLDRIDPTKGYVRGNVEIICWRCNALKRDATLKELRMLVAYMAERLS